MKDRILNAIVNLIGALSFIGLILLMELINDPIVQMIIGE